MAQKSLGGKSILWGKHMILEMLQSQDANIDTYSMLCLCYTVGV